MYRILVLLPLLLLANCSVYEQIAAGSQKIQVRIWKNFNPNLLQLATSQKWTVDTSEEQVVEFDTYITNNAIYLAYTTDKAVFSIKNPKKGDIPDNLLGTNRQGVVNSIPPDTILYQVENDGTHIKTYYTTSTGSNTNIRVCQSSSFYKGEEGVWVRILKGVRVGIDKNPEIKWALEFASKDSMDLSGIKIIPIPGQNSSIIAVSNQNKVIIINDKDKNTNVNFFSKDLFKRSAHKIKELNTWLQNDEVHIAGLVDGALITGKLINNIWFETYFSYLGDNIGVFNVEMGASSAYAIWLDKSKNCVTLGEYFPNKSRGDRWMALDSIRAVKLPQLSIAQFVDVNGIRQESPYVGTINKFDNFFQLNSIVNQKLYFDGPIIIDWNERYAFASNNRHQVLFARVNFDKGLIFAGLNSLKKWEPIQINRPPSVKVHPSSKLQVKFMNGKFPFVIFRQENGTIHLLEGIS